VDAAAAVSVNPRPRGCFGWNAMKPVIQPVRLKQRKGAETVCGGLEARAHLQDGIVGINVGETGGGGGGFLPIARARLRK